MRKCIGSLTLFISAFVCWSPATKADYKSISYFERRQAFCEVKQALDCRREPLTQAVPEQSPFRDFANAGIVLACENYYRDNRCEEVKAATGAANANMIMSCDLNKMCKDETDLDILKCSIEGIQMQFEIPTFVFNVGAAAGSTAVTAWAVETAGPKALGAALRFSSSAGIAALLPVMVYSASKDAKACDEDIKYKAMLVQMHNYSLLPSERPLDTAEKNREVLKMPCDDLKLFLKQRLETIASRREKNQEIPLSSKVLLRSLSSTRCFNQSVIKENLCRSLAGLATGAVVGGVATGMVGAVFKTLPGTAPLTFDQKFALYRAKTESTLRNRPSGNYMSNGSIFPESYFDSPGRKRSPLPAAKYPKVEPPTPSLSDLLKDVKLTFATKEEANQFLKPFWNDGYDNAFTKLGWDRFDVDIYALDPRLLATIIRGRIPGPRSQWIYHSTPAELVPEIQRAGQLNSALGPESNPGGLGIRSEGFWASADYNYVSGYNTGGLASRVIFRTRPDVPDVGRHNIVQMQPRHITELEYSFDGVHWYPGNFPIDQIPPQHRGP